MEKDESGVWYEFALTDHKTNQKYSAGCLHFPSATINSGGGTWLEVYSGARSESEVPETELRVLSLTANGLNLRPIKCRVCYGNFSSSDAYMNDGVLILSAGRGVTCLHEASHYILSE